MGGRGSSGSRNEATAESLARIPFDKRNEVDDSVIEKVYGEYQYHATTGTAIFSIYEQGLKPHAGQAGKGVYFAPSAKDAIAWTTSTSTGGTTPLRVKTSTLYKKYQWGDLGLGESSADKKISSKDIEIRTPSGTWRPLSEHVKKAHYSYEAWKRNQRKRG